MARVWGTFAKLGFRRPLVRPKELKPRERHDLDPRGSGGRSAGGGALVGAR